MIVDLLHQRLPSLSGADRAIALEIARTAQRRLERIGKRSRRLCTRRRVQRLCARYEEVWRARGGRPDPGASRFRHACEQIGLRRARAGQALCEGSALGTDEALHAARVAVKRWRYASERLGAVVPAADGPTREWLKSVQQTLGRISDLRVLRASTLRWAEKRGPPGAGTAKPAPWGGLLEGFEEERSECIEELRRLLEAQRLTPGPAPAPPTSAGGTRPDP